MRFPIWQAAWAALVIAGHVALVPGLKANPRWIELVLLVGYGLLVVGFMRPSELRPRPVRVEAAVRIGLAALETAASLTWLGGLALAALEPPRAPDHHPTMPLGLVFLVPLAFTGLAVITIVLLQRAGDRAIVATRLTLIACTIVTVASFVL